MLALRRCANSTRPREEFLESASVVEFDSGAADDSLNGAPLNPGAPDCLSYLSGLVAQQDRNALGSEGIAGDVVDAFRRQPCCGRSTVEIG
jgi:hypothetical protein